MSARWRRGRRIEERGEQLNVTSSGTGRVMSPVSHEESSQCLTVTRDEPGASPGFCQATPWELDGEIDFTDFGLSMNPVILSQDPELLRNSKFQLLKVLT